MVFLCDFISSQLALQENWYLIFPPMFWAHVCSIQNYIISH